MTTLKEIIDSIDFEDKKTQTEPDWERMANYFNIYDLYWSEDPKLTAYHVKVWLCTDTWVGWVAYFLEDDLVCLSTQSARKSDVHFKFVSKESHTKLRDYLLSLTQSDDAEEIELIDFNLEIPERYSIEYNSQILHRKAWYFDTKVNIKRTTFPYTEDNRDRYFHMVEIEHENGTIEEVSCSDLKFEYNSLS